MVAKIICVIILVLVGLLILDFVLVLAFARKQSEIERILKQKPTTKKDEEIDDEEHTIRSE